MLSSTLIALLAARRDNDVQISIVLTDGTEQLDITSVTYDPDRDVLVLRTRRVAGTLAVELEG